MTFSEFIIKEKGYNFYKISLMDMIKQNNSNVTIEKYFSDLYTEYKCIYSPSIDELNKDLIDERIISFNLMNNNTIYELSCKHTAEYLSDKYLIIKK